MTKQHPIVLISCVKSKRTRKCMARDMYTSALFKKMMDYALSLQPKKIFILSALHGLLEVDQEISPYEKTLKNMGVKERKAWASGVIGSLRERCDLTNDEFIILAGVPYREHLTPVLEKYSVPMEGLSFGQQLKWLGEHTNDEGL